jgi:phenylacetic acid degradation operon negative regulatory protein
MPRAGPVADLLQSFQAAKPVRAWSLIITLYGDAVVPRGGRLGLKSLIDIMGLFGIDSGHVRTAMSRLTSDGWLERERIGRNSYYRLSRRGQASFLAATRRIYFPEAAPFDGKLRLALLGPGISDRRLTRSLLEQEGFAPFSPVVYVGLVDPLKRVAAPAAVVVVRADAGEAAAALASAAWKLPAIAESYRGFVARFKPLETALSGSQALTGGDALVARILLIHEFRRIVLRDPGLPGSLLPGDWPAQRARALAARIYGRVVPVAERFLDANAGNESGPLPPPEPSFAQRFSPNWRP